MTALPPGPWTWNQFLTWEEQQEERYEFNGVEPEPMGEANIGHELIGGALRALLHGHLKGGPCRVLGPTLKVGVAGSIRYPDAFVSCTFVPFDETIIADPVVVFEIISPASSYKDRITKLLEYRATASIRRYIILEHDIAGASVFVRDGEDWLATVVIGDEALAIPEVGIEFPLSKVYADFDL